MSSVPAKAANWKIIIAFLLDLFSSFLVFGYMIASIFGGKTATGFSIEGVPALICFVPIIAYFLIGNRTGGTVWKRILRVPVK